MSINDNVEVVLKKAEILLIVIGRGIEKAKLVLVPAKLVILIVLLIFGNPVAEVPKPIKLDVPEFLLDEVSKVIGKPDANGIIDENGLELIVSLQKPIYFHHYILFKKKTILIFFDIIYAKLYK